MRDPERLLSSDATEFERFVLGAARFEHPSPAQRSRMRRALVLAEFGFLATSLKAVAGVAGHWVTVAVVAGALGGSGSSSELPSAPLRHESKTVVAASRRAAPTVTDLSQPSDLEATPAEELELVSPEEVAPRASHRAAGPPRAVDLREEIRLLDQARAELRASAASRALTTLSQYRSQFPRGSFLQEAAVLRIEALAASGNRALATSEAKRFIAQHPRSPYVERLARLGRASVTAKP